MIVTQEMDLRIKQILDWLAEGLTREEVAERLGYKDFKSLDQFMRRHGHTWDSRRATYTKDSDKKHKQPITTKALEVIALFEKPNADAKEIARKLHFANHYEMAKYMQARGYVWSSELGNYVSRDGKSPVRGNSDQEAKEAEVNGDTTKLIDPGDYLHILSLLVKNEDKLVRLFEQINGPSSEIPRYVVPGAYTVKSIHMSVHLDQLVKQFSREKNISQKEIFEVAIIQFFQRYGYGAYVDELLEKRA